ncbi:MAG: hypothetical protein B7Z60_07485 [Ferrovum sp. 37-45-19]|uniref:c-type cytochrome n=1 Tax=Ferrovum sp. JA12 TaxID=1356299 RepID=UPI000703715F|nr:hypothetical protein [Ferrovum sp. JA12]OYV79140.1 MAG: hypothetical protein B7Z65_07565 [Ferrovum sp. 21-44-67]OYV93730.1 MAG: hypothetical protein B7Z60_07485 [Ferrovum sp. 37-45-19]OZB32261.1 MAG: hypothetical protein B7X47_06830 [Ferrovum sp. 34-44-207]HQT81336.1 hypothetical protein [Ferrovaceae bacterium]KRH78570.1 cytochrome c-552 precursor [Ferrovum sp. JA12]
MKKNAFIFLFIGSILLFIIVTNFMHMRLARSTMMMGNRMSLHPQQPHTTPSTIFVNAGTEEVLTRYILSHHLRCLECHEINQNKVGPAYVLISQKYPENPEAVSTLTQHIANGYGAMPGELATAEEAHDLAAMIMKLTKKLGQ